MNSIGFSNFALNRHVHGSGLSFFTISNAEVIDRISNNWSNQKPGTGEVDCSRKILIDIDPKGFYLGTTKLTNDLPLKARVTKRQAHEQSFVEVYVSLKDALQHNIEYSPANYCTIVLYSREALLENNGECSTDCDWEIVAILARNELEDYMPPLTMARNFLEMPGGTKSVYSAEEFAKSIWHHSSKEIKIIKDY
jgi:hypothetical protein